ncbi:FadR family transcriptional regulator [Streptomyces gardneri]|nr:FadR family transcriptional regulator [Streptomyces gardneri]
MTDLRIHRPERLVRNQVTDALRKAVLDGVLNPGDLLTERKLVELTAVSRTSLREGLRQLRAEGLIEPAPGRVLQVILLREQSSQNCTKSANTSRAPQWNCSSPMSPANKSQLSYVISRTPRVTTTTQSIRRPITTRSSSPAQETHSSSNCSGRSRLESS